MKTVDSETSDMSRAMTLSTGDTTNNKNGNSLTMETDMAVSDTGANVVMGVGSADNGIGGSMTLTSSNYSSNADVSVASLTAKFHQQ